MDSNDLNRSNTGLNKQWAEGELTRKLSEKPSGSITIPIVPADAALPQYEDPQDTRITELKDTIAIQKQVITLLEHQIEYLNEQLKNASFPPHGCRMD